MREIALVSAFALAASAESNLIEIYKNASFIHQNFSNQKSEFSLNLPDFVELEDIDVAALCELLSLNLNEASKCWSLKLTITSTSSPAPPLSQRW